MRALEKVSLSWKEGLFFDFWTLPHLMTGAIGGFVSALIGLSASTVFAVGFVMMVAWEGIEFGLGIRESWPNRILDVVVGLVGLAIALAISPVLGRTARAIAFALSFGIGATSGLIGWRASSRRKRSVRKAEGTG